MDVELIDEEETVLPRTEYTFKVTHQGTTPNRLDLKDKAHLHIDDDKDLLIIRNLPSTYQGKTFTVTARQYHNEHAMHHLEHNAMIDKNAARSNEEDES